MIIISCSPYNADTVSDDVISCIRIEIGKVLYHFGQCKQSAMLFASSREILVLLLNDNNYDDDGSYLNAILHGVIAYGDNNAKEEEATSPSNNKNIISYYKEVINMGSMLLGTLHIDNAIVNQNVGSLSRAYYCMGHLELENHTWQRLWPLRLTRCSFPCHRLTLCPNGRGRVNG